MQVVEGKNAGDRANSEASSVQEPEESQVGPINSKETPADPIIEEEQPDDVPIDDEDALLHPEFVIGKQPKGKEVFEDEDYILPPQFDETVSDER